MARHVLKVVPVHGRPFAHDYADRDQCISDAVGWLKIGATVTVTSTE